MKPIYEIDKQANNENEPSTATVCDDSAGKETKIEADGKNDKNEES